MQFSIKGQLFVPILDTVVRIFYETTSNEQRIEAHNTLVELQRSEIWTEVPRICQTSKYVPTKYYALGVLEGVIKYTWNRFPVQTKDAIRTFIYRMVELLVTGASDQMESFYVNKLYSIFVQILKHEGSVDSCRKFISYFVSPNRPSGSMAILRVLIEEVYVFHEGTGEKIPELQDALRRDYKCIHSLFLNEISESRGIKRRKATLSTLEVCLSWVLLRPIFETPLLEKLIRSFKKPYDALTLQILTEVASFNCGNGYDEQYVKMYKMLMDQLPAELKQNSPQEVVTYAETESHMELILNLAVFFTTFFEVRIHVLESNQENQEYLTMGLRCLINMSYIDDTHVCEVCLRFWHLFVAQFFMPRPSLEFDVCYERRGIYACLMQDLRKLMICRMAKPEGLLIVLDAKGNPVEKVKDDAVPFQYMLMKETLIALYNLDPVDTRTQMLDKLREEFCEEKMKTLCWAIGSISAIVQLQDYDFLSEFFDRYNTLMSAETDDYAVIASIMLPVFAEFPSSLLTTSNRDFLEGLLVHLFSIIGGEYPGVQDIACSTLLKVVKRCKLDFVIPHNPNFTLPQCLSALFVLLEPHQKYSLCESVALMIIAESNQEKRVGYLQLLMQSVGLNSILLQLHSENININYFRDPNVIRTVLNILQRAKSIASYFGTCLPDHFLLILPYVSAVFSVYSNLILKISKITPVEQLQLRLVKRETINLIALIVMQARPEFLSGIDINVRPIVNDYNESSDEVRESEVLSLLATLINKFGNSIADWVPWLFDNVFPCTKVEIQVEEPDSEKKRKLVEKAVTQKIVRFLEGYPELRLKLFSFFQAIATHCPLGLIRLSTERLHHVMLCIRWAVRHTESNIAEAGLNLLLNMLHIFKLHESRVRDDFYRKYFIILVEDMFDVLNDTDYKSSFDLHISVLMFLIRLVYVEPFSLSENLWRSNVKNSWFVIQLISMCLIKYQLDTFHNVIHCADGLVQLMNNDVDFKSRIREFIYWAKEVSQWNLNVRF